MSTIIVSEELKAYIDPLTPEEYEALERSLLAEGCRDALVLWGDILVDGHNRYGICQKHGLPFKTMQHPKFKSIEDVHLWMIDQHLGRRSVSDFQRGVLALRKREILAERQARKMAELNESQPAAAEGPAADDPEQGADAGAAGAPAGMKSRADIARAARLSNSQVVMIEKIQKQAAPEVVAAVKAGTISINAAAAVATLPEEEQKAAAMAGKDELKQAAKRVREVKRKPRDDAAPGAEGATEAGEGDDAAESRDEVPALRKRVAELTAENKALRAQVAELLTRVGR